jgi:ribosome biogenesis SPOUT family RNA methylase Rps3
MHDQSRSRNKPVVIIEHCEDSLSPWIILEYRHASMIYGRDYLLFTNIPAKYQKILSKYGRVREESVVELVNGGEIPVESLIILDPKASSTLEYSDLASAEYVVVGGILGEHPPRGRTWMYITSRMPIGARAFNIGDGQYSIDGAVYFVNYLWLNKGVSGYQYIDGVRVETEGGEIYLPYRYPVVGGKPLLADGLEYYLKYRRIRDDIWREILLSDS